MKICLGTNWDDKLLEGVDDLNKEYEDVKIYEVFGAYKTSVVGSGRVSIMLPKVTPNQAKDHIELARSVGLKFNYLINACCMGNREFHPKYHAQLIEYLDEIVNLGPDYVTVAIPYLIEIVRDQYPDLGIAVSSFCEVDSVRKAMFFEDLGADRIILSKNIRRKFELIKNICEATECDVEVLANLLCIYQCPYEFYHRCLTSHGSQTTSVEHGGHYVQYPMFHCNITRLSDPSEIIKSNWVRPEDTHKYVDLGADFIKITERRWPTSRLLRAAKAYLSQRYDGNLYDLLSQTVLGHLQYSPLNREPLAHLEINIDNQALDGFLDFFEEGKCGDDCSACNYCDKVAEKVVHMDDELTAKYVESSNKILRHMITSKFVEDFEEKDRMWKDRAPRDGMMVAMAK